MPVDPWATTTAQEFPPQSPPGWVSLAERLAAQKRAMFDLRASVLANVSDIVADLRVAVDALAVATAAATAASATATAASAAATAAVANLASRVSVTATIASFSTPSLPNDATWHAYGADIPITIAVPTGKLVVTVGCGEARLVGIGGGTITADATFSISGGIANYEDVYAAVDVASPTTFSGASLCVQRTFTVSPGTYTITGKMGAWATGTTTGRVDFNSPYLTVQVTG